MLLFLGSLDNGWQIWFDILNLFTWIDLSPLHWILIIVVGCIVNFFIGLRRLTRSGAIYVGLIFSTLIILAGFLYFIGPPGVWVVVVILPVLLFFGLVLYTEETKPELKEKY